MPEGDSHVCEKCGRSFDSKRGLSIHKTQSHSEDEEKDDIKEESETASEPNSWEKGISISVRQALISAFILGIVVGFTAGVISPLSLSDGSTTPSDPTGDTEPTNSDRDTTPSVSKINLTDEPVMGQEDAPVTMVMYEDFQCPYCKVFEQRSFGKIKSQLVDTGKLKVVWKDFPLQSAHPWATDASEAMECVYRQDNDVFWTLKNRVFQNQDSLTTQNVQSQITSWAVEEGLSESAIKSCLESGDARKEVMSDLQEGKSFDTYYKSQGRWVPFISGTPSFVIFGEGDSEAEQMVGAQPFSSFKSTVESQATS